MDSRPFPPWVLELAVLLPFRALGLAIPTNYCSTLAATAVTVMAGRPYTFAAPPPLLSQALLEREDITG
jgi:hypothetical protein